MIDRLVTIAHYGDTFEASIARNFLENEGITAFLEGAAIVGMAWHLTGAVGGVKLQVAESNAERAVQLLEAQRHAPHEESFADDFDTDDFDAEDFDDEDDGEPPKAAKEFADDASRNASEELAARAIRASVLSLMLSPLVFYAAWLIVRVAGNYGDLRSKYRYQMVFAAAICLAGLSIWGIVAWLIFKPSNPYDVHFYGDGPVTIERKFRL